MYAYACQIDEKRLLLWKCTGKTIRLALIDASLLKEVELPEENQNELFFQSKRRRLFMLSLTAPLALNYVYMDVHIIQLSFRLTVCCANCRLTVVMDDNRHTHTDSIYFPILLVLTVSSFCARIPSYYDYQVQ